LAQALGYEAIKQGKEVLCRSIFDLVRDFMKDEAFKQQDRTLRRYLKPDLVIIDDMGLKALPKQSGEYLLEVVMRRYENRSTIMTSNRPLEDWGKLLSDVPTAGAILDRFLHTPLPSPSPDAVIESKTRCRQRRRVRRPRSQTNRRPPGPRAEGSQLGPGSF
jgi:DNA replication protein DnaC